MRKTNLPTGIYGITYDNINLDFVIQTKKMIKLGANIIQIRTSKFSEKELLRIAKKVKEICRKNNITLIINNSVKISRTLNENIHLGPTDANPKRIRKEGFQKIIGYSINGSNIFEFTNTEKYVDYFGVGPIFNSQTAPHKAPIGLKNAKRIIKKSKIPVYVIGGINEENLDEILSLNPAGVCLTFRKFIQNPKLVEKINKFYRR